jgi:pyruvate kinase
MKLLTNRKATTMKKIPVKIYEEIKPEDVLVLSDGSTKLSTTEVIKMVKSVTTPQDEFEWIEGIPYRVTYQEAKS